MIHAAFDVAVIGSGFAGSLSALIARRLGRRVCLLEQQRHPRFTIGESSTPLADFLWQFICREYDLTHLLPFAKYGTWKENFPHINCGLKRGFSFYGHRPGQFFDPGQSCENVFAVAASPTDLDADTQWYRPAFDHYLMNQAVSFGVDYWDRCQPSVIAEGPPWTIHVRRSDSEDFTVTSTFVVDATGQGQFWQSLPGVRAEPLVPRARTRAVYGHFRGVTRWEEFLVPALVADFPFRPDDSAVHQVFPGGWMWQLRFDDDVVSAGFSIDADRFPRPAINAANEWHALLDRLPTVAQQFQNAVAVSSLYQTDRLQRWWSPAAGPGWMALPHAVGFVDPWLSPGIALSLLGVLRLGAILADQSECRLQQEYDQLLRQELAWIDQLDAACFAQLGDFEKLQIAAKIYFIAAIFTEESIRNGADIRRQSFLLADDANFRSACQAVFDALPHHNTATCHQLLIEKLAAYDRVGLLRNREQRLFPFVSQVIPEHRTETMTA